MVQDDIQLRRSDISVARYSNRTHQPRRGDTIGLGVDLLRRLEV
jgi:hypothetical protein